MTYVFQEEDRIRLRAQAVVKGLRPNTSGPLDGRMRPSLHEQEWAARYGTYDIPCTEAWVLWESKGEERRSGKTDAKKYLR